VKKLEHIMRDVNNGWLIRYLHSTAYKKYGVLHLRFFCDRWLVF